MFTAFITLTPGHHNKGIGFQQFNDLLAVQPIIEVKTLWSLTMELLLQAYRLEEFTCNELQNPKYCDYWPLITTQNRCIFVQYLMEVLKPCPYAPCRCQRDIQSHCLTLTQSTMTSLNIWTALCEYWLT